MSGAGQIGPARRRSAARLACVQALYEMDVAGASSDDVLQEFMTRRWRNAGGDQSLVEPDALFLGRLIRGTSGDLPRLDGAIAGVLSEDHPLDRLEVLLRAVLRAGAYELSSLPDVPTNVVIDEYVNVAHAFFGGKEPALVNAVLDHLARAVRTVPENGHGDERAPKPG